MKSLKPFFKIILSFFIVISMVLLFGRNHFFLGTGLLFGRWILLALSMFFIFRVRKKTPTYYFKILCLLSSLLVVEYIWNFFNKASIRDKDSSKEISILTYNLFFKNKQPNSVIKIINSSKADILLVQELTPQWKTLLDQSLKIKYQYKKLIPLKGTHGIGIYSRYKILNNKIFNNTSNLPVALLSEIQIGKKKIQVINTHIASPSKAIEKPKEFFKHFQFSYQQRKLQLAQINDWVKQRENSIDAHILSGDLNTMRYEPLFRDLSKEWVDLFNEKGKGFGFNFPNTNKVRPFTTLDYILLKGNIKPISIEVKEGGSSDHLAVFGKIKI